jgi:cytidine deaminase
MDPRNIHSLLHYRLFFEKLPVEETREWLHPNHVSVFFQLWEHLIDRAREAADKFAFSYRNFKVGCAVLAFSREQQMLAGYKVAGYKVFTGFNVKPQSGDGPNIHAEEIAIGAARAEGYDTIVAITVVGETQEDHQSGKTMPTLHPCGRCRALLSALPEVKNSTIILTAHFKDNTCEIMECEELQIRHSYNKPK